MTLELFRGVTLLKIPFLLALFQLKSRPLVPYLLSDVRAFSGCLILSTIGRYVSPGSITAGFADIIVLMFDLFINP